MHAISVEVMNRALVVDTLSVSEQAGGNAWAACMHGIGGIVGFFVYASLVRVPFCSLTSLFLFASNYKADILTCHVYSRSLGRVSSESFLF
jgi:hypothetical protein